MRYLKNNLKVIISFILGIILASGITVYATSYFAKDITYTREDTNIKSVEDALNDLYEKDNTLTFYVNTFWGNGGNNSGVSIYTHNYPDYKYYKFTEGEAGTSSSVSITKYNWSNNGATTSLSFNTIYERTNQVEEIFFCPGNNKYRTIKVEFFK